MRPRLYNKSLFARDCVVADAVTIEPVSAAKFHITGKNTGKTGEIVTEMRLDHRVMQQP
jgi:hypothetical protein